MRLGDPKRREERAKIAATWLNNVNVVVFGGGIVGPVFLGTFTTSVAAGAIAFSAAAHVAAHVASEFVAIDTLKEAS